MKKRSIKGKAPNPEHLYIDKCLYYAIFIIKNSDIALRFSIDCVSAVKNMRKGERSVTFTKAVNAAVLIAAALLLASCTDADDGVSEDTVPEVQTSLSADDNAMRITETEVSFSEPFSEYTFELKGGQQNYMVTVCKGELPEEILINVENNRYERSSFVITAPAGYRPSFPYDASRSADVVNIITNDIDSTVVPDIMQFIFYATENDESNSAAYAVSRFYTVVGDELREINILDIAEDGTKTARDYLDRIFLYHTEADKFICEITVDDRNLMDVNGALKDISDRVRINTLTFDSSIPALISGYEEISEDNPLYFGYAYWAAANTAAQYFTVETLPVSDYANYIEIPSEEYAELSDYYFKISDERFTCTTDLRSYLELFFSNTVAERLLADAPMKYCDVDGELYGIIVEDKYNTTLGTLTFSGMDISENKMIFRSRQEKYDSFGNYVGYTDGGNFVIEKQDDASWRVIQYRYPYE